MKMVITLKNGVQIKADVDSYTIGTSPVFTIGSPPVSGELREVKWISAERPDNRLRWLNLSEVAAIHSEFDWDGADQHDPPIPPVEEAAHD